MPNSPTEIYRIKETPKGSTIWDLASQNRDIIEKFAFWDEKWQQRGRMNEIQNLLNVQEKMEGSFKQVKEYWKEQELDGIWRKWIKPNEWNIMIEQDQQAAIIKELNSRKIKARIGDDILRWGNSTKGSFTVKEAYKF